MNLQELKDLESKLIGKLRQHNVKDVKKGFRLFNNMHAEILDDQNDYGIYSIDILNNSTSALISSVTVSFSKDIADMCKCTDFEKTGSCKHITAAIIEMIYQETELEVDEIEELALTNESSDDSYTIVPVVPLFKKDIDSVPWHKF